MTPDQQRRARDLFEEAVDEPIADLEGWLGERCDDGEVRREVASLLLHHSRAGEFLTRPAGDIAELLDDSERLEPGQQLGPYRIEREAGRGGMGRVYRATDTRLNRPVAIKALPAELATDASQRERLRREARAAARLSHPGICTVYALEELDGELYIVSEFIEGRTLHEEIAGEHRPTAARLRDTAHQLASALASAHEAGITHRDLKPDNVMRTSDGRIKILDFGLARLSQPTVGVVAPLVTQAGAVLGTPAYMAPEQLNGQPADPRTDVFAFGVLMYEYATGRHPFEAATPLARAGRVLEATPEPLGRLRPDVPGDLIAVVERCLAKAPGDRFGSAGDLLRALPAAADSGSRPLPLMTPPAPLVAAGTAWWRFHQVVAIALYLTAVILAWFVKEWLPGPTATVFIALGILGTIVGMLRGHLVFTERTHGVGLHAERRRLDPITLVIDLLMALLLAGDGLALVNASREVAGVLTIALAVGIAVTRLVLEPGTARAAFGDG